jgi:hypothetical protein
MLNRDSVVSTVARLRHGRYRVRISAETREHFLPRSIQISSRTHKTSHLSVRGVVSPEKTVGAWRNSLTGLEWVELYLYSPCMTSCYVQGQHCLYCTHKHRMWRKKYVSSQLHSIIHVRLSWVSYINWLVLVIETACVYCAVRIVSLNIIQIIPVFKWSVTSHLIALHPFWWSVSCSPLEGATTRSVSFRTYIFTAIRQTTATKTLYFFKIC